ncbi:hypothetical protein V3C99_016873, partial [Haemonchus contortus]
HSLNTYIQISRLKIEVANRIVAVFEKKTSGFRTKPFLFCISIFETFILFLW